MTVRIFSCPCKSFWVHLPLCTRGQAEGAMYHLPETTIVVARCSSLSVS